MIRFRGVSLRIILGLVTLVTGCGVRGMEPEKYEWLEATRELVGEMCELARNDEALEWFTSHTGLLDRMREMGEGTYRQPQWGWVAEVPDEVLLEGLLALSKTELSGEEIRKIPKVLRNRINPSLLVSACRAMGREGTELAAYTILTTSKTYVRPQDWRENLLVVLDYGEKYAWAATFWESGEGTVTGSVTFVRAETGRLMYEWFEGGKMKIWRLSEVDLQKMTL